MTLSRFAFAVLSLSLSACAAQPWHQGQISTPQHHVDRGQALINRGAYPAAINAFNRARQIQPSSQAEIGLARARFALGDYTLAMSHIEQALVINPDQADTYVWRGRLHQQLGQTLEALDNYNTALDMDPYCVNCLLARADIYHSIGELDAAAEDTQRVLQIEPNNAKAQQHRQRTINTQANNRRF